jgi:uncharacterized protein YdaU (DUF1376 family)
MKSPAFRFYPSDFWGSPDVQAMDLHEVGAYLSLMSAAWLSEEAGCLPDDDEKLRRWARMTREQWEQSRDTLLLKFPVLAPGIRANPRLYREAEKQEAFSASQSAKGRKGGRPKAGEKLGLSEAKPGLSVGLSPEKPSVSVSVSASVLKEQVLFAPAMHAPVANAPRDEKPKTPRTGKQMSKASPSEVETIWSAYPLKKGKSKAVPIIERVLAKLRSDGIDQPAELLVERIGYWIANREKAQAQGSFVPEMPYPQKFFGRGDWDDDDAKPKPKAVFDEVPLEQWLGPEGKL